MLLLDVPPTEVLWRAILGGLGYSRNQVPMRRLAEQLPLSALEDLRLTQAPAKRFPLTLGLLLGVAGFLPLSPSESHLIKLDSNAVLELELAWKTIGSPWHAEPLRPSDWDRARLRPANHPLPRLHAAAALIQNAAAEGGLLAAIQAIVRADEPISHFRDFTGFGAMSGIGADRAVEILASEVLPVLFAVASHTGDDALADDAAHLWEKLPAPTATSVTKRAMKQVCGETMLRGIGARGAQGLVHLDTVLCLPRRCFDCPIAAAELLVND